MRAILKRVLTPPLVLIAAALILLEETLIKWAQRLMARLAALPLVAALEQRARRLPPYPAMILFLVPGAVLFPVKLAALWLLASGHVVWGTIIIVAGKLAGTAIGARIYLILRPTLVSLNWFARAEAWVFGWRDRIYARVRAMPAWQRAAAAIAAAKVWLRAQLAQRPGWLGRRFLAARRHARRS
ncbi:MAG: hypothetical protein KF889_15855 [Alphaproteobacteria bacterium]|nr:hypothetical protein [Alphaproteobacteria bacterium]MCW5740156.1 hypothetical protein [Alphaproteobacteria bacterium]